MRRELLGGGRLVATPDAPKSPQKRKELPTPSAPSASTVSWRRSAAARAAQGRGRASCRLRLAASPSSPRSPTSPARCPSVTTARARTAAKKRYACPPTHLKMLHGHTQACVSSVPVKQHEMARNVHVPFTVRQTPPRAASSQTATRTRCQRGASSALVAETAVRTLSGIGVLGRVPSGSRGGRVLSACIIFFVSWNSYGCNEPGEKLWAQM